MDYYQKHGAMLDKALTAVSKFLTSDDRNTGASMVFHRHMKLSAVDRAFVLGLAVHALAFDDAYNVDNPKHVVATLDLAFGMAYHATDEFRARGPLGGGK